MLLTQSSPKTQRMRVCHVASGTLTASLECVGIPIIPESAQIVKPYRMEMYMPCKATAVLVPESLQVVSLRRLPSLDSMAQIAAPEFGGRPASLLCMGWADHGGLIVVVWEAADAEVVVTVHLALSGASMQQMLHLTPHDPRHPISHNTGILIAFAASPNDPAAAIAWQSGGSNIHVALIDLACGTQKMLQRSVNPYTCGTCYNEVQDEEMEFAWSPGAGFLMVHETTEADGEGQDWAIFTSPAGVFAGPEIGCHGSDDPPMWSSDLLHPLCLIGDGLGAPTINAMDLSIVPPRPLPYLNSSGSGPYKDFGFDPAYSAFVPGKRDLVVFWPHRRPPDQNCPIQHFTSDSSMGSTVCHDVSGLDRELAGAFAIKRMAWQLTIKSAAIYALVERKHNGALHLIDAQKHRRLITWTSEKMASMLQRPISLGYAFLAWSCDGNELAVITKTGTAILSFSF